MAKTDIIPVTLDEFVYHGTPIYALKSVLDIEDIKQQTIEIENRLIAVRDYCLSHNVIMTPFHIINVLNVSKDAFNRMKSGSIKQNGKWVSVEASKRHNATDKANIRARSDLLRKWEDYMKQWCVDRINSDTIPTRAIYTSKAVFGFQDSPNSTSIDKRMPTIEVLIKKAQERP